MSETRIPLGALAWGVVLALPLAVLVSTLSALIERSGPIRMRHWVEEAGGRLRAVYDGMYEYMGLLAPEGDGCGRRGRGRQAGLHEVLVASMFPHGYGNEMPLALWVKSSAEWALPDRSRHAPETSMGLWPGTLPSA